jgi:hypothetical protein
MLRQCKFRRIRIPVVGVAGVLAEGAVMAACGIVAGAVMASALPAARAAGVDVMKALRADSRQPVLSAGSRNAATWRRSSC